MFETNVFLKICCLVLLQGEAAVVDKTAHYCIKFEVLHFWNVPNFSSFRYYILYLVMTTLDPGFLLSWVVSFGPVFVSSTRTWTNMPCLRILLLVIWANKFTIPLPPGCFYFTGEVAGAYLTMLEDGVLRTGRTMLIYWLSVLSWGW